MQSKTAVAAMNAATAVLLFFLVVRGIESIKILGIQVVLRDAKCLGKALIMHDLPFSQKLNDIGYVRIVTQPQNIVVGGSCLLLCYYHVFATKLWCVKVRKILILQWFIALLV